MSLISDEYNVNLVTMDEIFMSSYVDRWHMLRTARPQSNAEHSYRVALIAIKTAQLVYGHFGLPLTAEIREQVYERGLLHDIDEVMCGDTPGFVKNHYPAIREASALFWQDRLPCDYDKRVKWLVKYADIVEGYVYYYSNGGLGPHVDSTRRDWALANASDALVAHLDSGCSVFGVDDSHFFKVVLKNLAIKRRLDVDPTHG